MSEVVRIGDTPEGVIEIEERNPAEIDLRGSTPSQLDIGTTAPIRGTGDYSYYEVEAWAVLDGLGTIDIIGMNLNFDINQVPRGSITLAVGREVTSKKVGAGTSTAELKVRRAVQVYIRINGTRYKVFDGYTSGISTSRAPNQVGVMVMVVHWLDTLRATSALSDSRTPLALWDVENPITQRSLVGNDKPTFSLDGYYAEVEEIATSDLGSMISTMSNQLASGEIGKTELSNEAAKSVFSKISASLKLAFEMSGSVAGGVAKAFVNAFVMVFAGGVLWDSYVKLAGQFLYAIVPTVDYAAFVPWAPVLDNVSNVLSSDEYVYLRMSDQVRKRIIGLVLYDEDTMDSRPDVKATVLKSAYFVETDEVGMVDAMPLPQWLRSPIKNDAGTYTDVSIRSRGRVPTAEERRVLESVATQRERESDSVAALGRNFAQMVLLDRQYRYNTGTLQGPLRFDVGVGTNIGIEIPDMTTARKVVCGHVTGVTIDINIQRSLAMTSYRLTHLRSAEDSKGGVASNPLYTTLLASSDLLAAPTIENVDTDETQS